MLMHLCCSDGIKNCLTPFPGRAQQLHQANHRLVVRNQNFAFLERNGKWRLPTSKAIFTASLQSDGTISRTDSMAASIFKYQSAPTYRIEPGASIVPVGSAIP